MSVRHSLLAILSEGPRYGQQLQHDFEARTGRVWPLNVGQVYSTLQRLERDDLIESVDSAPGGHRKRFRITAAGSLELDRWLRSAVATSPPRDELLIKVLIAWRLPGARFGEILQDHRRQLVTLMQGYTRLKMDESGDDPSLAVLIDAELFRLEAAVRWLDAADARLSRLSAESPTVASLPAEVGTAERVAQ